MLVQTLKGFRDFLPPEARKRQYVINTLKSVFESYGFEPLETPALEYDEILTGKYGTEGDKLMYRFKDNGDRNVAMRYDQTVPLARVVAQYQNELPMPFKRYQVQPVWRAENTQRGRFREFLQCDIDTVGTNSPFADAEILAIINDSFEALGFKNFKILVNDRTLFADLPPKAIITIDKLKKIGTEAVKKELEALGVKGEKLEELVGATPTENLEKIMQSAEEFGVNNARVTFESTLARGLDYYTGLIIEVEIDGYTVGSVGGGGRYDNLVGMFSDRQLPAVGFAFGFDRIIEAMTEQKLFPDDLSSTKVLVTIFSQELLDNSIEACYQLRAQGIATDLYLDPEAKMEKQLKYADQKDIPYAIVIGPEEVKKEKVVLKNLKTREQRELTLDQLPDALK
ncbi:MAG TPA: histidine--tRNA ligase [Patescibacteria group bacterium]|nr:histidine--tRNA ligase [Patescibacteria group bacterium]